MAFAAAFPAYRSRPTLKGPGLLPWPLVWALMACGPGAAHAARLALVVGNDNYTQIEPLRNARNDAKLVGEVLRKAGFDVAEASNLDRNGLWAALDRLKARLKKDDEVVFYFAGHGVQIGANQLLLPIDISPINEAQVQRDGVPLVEVQDSLKDARFALLLIDACRDNPFPKTGTRSMGGTRGLSPPEAAIGQVIMLSAGRNQKALDRVPGSPQANGLFAWELSQVLAQPGLEIRAALEDVKNRVDQQARKVGHEQRPSLVNDLIGPYLLMPGRSTVPSTAPATTSPQTAAPVVRSPVVLFERDFSKPDWVGLTGWELTLPWNSTHKTTDADVRNGAAWIEMRTTDKGASILSPAFKAAKRVRLTARVYLEPNKRHPFLPNIQLMDEQASPSQGGQPKRLLHVGLIRSSFGPDHACSGPDKPRVTDGGGCVMGQLLGSEVSSSSLYNRWITPSIIYDEGTGAVEVDFDGDGKVDFTGTISPSQRFKPSRVSFSGFGWYTGHRMGIQWVRVEDLGS